MRIEPLNKTFGAKIYELSIPLLDAEELKVIYDLWLQHCLLIFPNQNLTNEEQIKFAKNFGEKKREWMNSLQSPKSSPFFTK